MKVYDKREENYTNKCCAGHSTVSFFEETVVADPLACSEEMEWEGEEIDVGELIPVTAPT